LDRSIFLVEIARVPMAEIFRDEVWEAFRDADESSLLLLVDRSEVRVAMMVAVGFIRSYTVKEIRLFVCLLLKI